MFFSKIKYPISNLDKYSKHICETDNHITDEMLTQMFFKVGSKYLVTFQTALQTG